MIAASRQRGKRTDYAWLTEDERREIVRLLDDGAPSLRAIARKVGRNWHTVAAVLDRARKPRPSRPYVCGGCRRRTTIKPCLVCRCAAQND